MYDNTSLTTQDYRNHRITLARNLSDFLNNVYVKELAFGRRSLYPWLAGVNCRPNRNYGAVLYEIISYFLPDKKGNSKLDKWDSETNQFEFWHTAKQFAEKINVSVPTVRRALKRLKKIGLINYQIKKSCNITCYHITFCYEKFYDLVLFRVVQFGDEVIKLINLERSLCSFTTYIYKVLKKSINIEKVPKTKESKPPPTASDSAYLENRKDTTLPNNNMDEIEPNARNVDEKINKNKPNHKPEGDRHFGYERPITKEKRRAKMSSAIGMSNFKDQAQMNECRQELVKFYFDNELFDFHNAEKVVSREINDAVWKGLHSQLIQEYLAKKELGIEYKKEWEIVRGRLYPAFKEFLIHQIKRNGETKQATERALGFVMKDQTFLRNSWAECKRSINVQRHRIIQAEEQGRDVFALDIPQWYLSAFREEIEVEQIYETAEVLQNISIEQNRRINQVQQKMFSEGKELPKLEGFEKVSQIFNNFGVIGVDQNDVQQQKQIADRVMDRIDRDARKLDQKSEDEQMTEVNTTLRTKVRELLKDPILRNEGIKLANKYELELVYDAQGEAIAIAKTPEEQEKDNVQINAAARKIYQPDKQEKGSFDWGSARARLRISKGK